MEAQVDNPLTEQLKGGAGQLTYSHEDGWIGFDTAHAWDIWPGLSQMIPSEYSVFWTEELLIEQVI